jgi:hypothetical protein
MPTGGPVGVSKFVGGLISPFFPRPSCKARGRGQGATIHQLVRVQDTSKNWRGFVDKNEARVASGSGPLYSGDAYSSTDVLDTIC